MNRKAVVCTPPHLLCYPNSVVTRALMGRAIRHMNALRNGAFDGTWALDWPLAMHLPSPMLRASQLGTSLLGPCAREACASVRLAVDSQCIHWIVGYMRHVDKGGRGMRGAAH